MSFPPPSVDPPIQLTLAAQRAVDAFMVVHDVHGVDAAMGGAARMSDVDVAEAGIAAAASGVFLCVPGTANRLLVALSALLPQRVSAYLVARLQQQRLATSTGR